MNIPVSSKRILIVEDDLKTAKALQIRLESSGFTVSVASDAVRGLSLATETQQDLILLDISMPGGSGLALARHLQALPGTRRTPVIFVTGSSDPNLRREVMTLNAAGLCEKPYDPVELLSLVEFALSETSSFQRSGDL